MIFPGQSRYIPIVDDEKNAHQKIDLHTAGAYILRTPQWFTWDTLSFCVYGSKIGKVLPSNTCLKRSIGRGRHRLAQCAQLAFTFNHVGRMANNWTSVRNGLHGQQCSIKAQRSWMAQLPPHVVHFSSRIQRRRREHHLWHHCCSPGRGELGECGLQSEFAHRALQSVNSVARSGSGRITTGTTHLRHGRRKAQEDLLPDEIHRFRNLLLTWAMQ